MGMCMSKTGLFMSPDVQVLDAHVKSVGLSGVNLAVELQANNPNPASLPVVRIVYTLKKVSDGTVLAEGVSHQQITLPANGRRKITIPMTFKYMGLGAAGKSLITRGKTAIDVSGDITFEADMTPGGTATSRFHDECEVALGGP